MKLFKVVLTTEIVVIANNEREALREAEACQGDVADNCEFQAVTSAPVLTVKDIPPAWHKLAIPWNGSETIERILEK